MAALLAAALSTAACHHQKPAEVPGSTRIRVEGVEIRSRNGRELALDYAPLLEKLGLRAGSLVQPERRFNPFRLAEDRRRLLAYLHMHGRFDAEVDEPEVEERAGGSAVAVTWTVSEGPAYRIASVRVEDAPPGEAARLREEIPFGPGDPVDLATYRPLRRELAESLQARGYGHARVYSRAFVRREDREVDWYYYVDAGPRTRVGSIQIEGNHRIPDRLIRERLGLDEGDTYSRAAKRRAELALLDTGAFDSAAVLTDADVQRGPPEYPDTGGELAAERISEDGELVPRDLDPELDLRVRVVEAPAKKLRAEAGIEGDPTRVDSFAGGRAELRDLFGPQHHLVFEGRVAYGWLAEGEGASGVYGDALARYVHPGWIARSLDLRVTAAYEDRLFPTFAAREARAGPGVRSTLAEGIFFDLDAAYRWSRQRGLDVSPAVGRALSLADETTSAGAELRTSLVADRRDDRIEPTGGYLLALRGALSPGGPLGDHRYARARPEARGFLPLSDAWSLGARASGGWIFAGEEGVPAPVRLFGGGAYGMRGFGRQRLATATCMDALEASCEEPELVGGMSLAEASLEARYLPFRELYGLTAFFDVGGAGGAENPLAEGVSAATGLGARLRTWYVPISIDVSYRLLEAGEGTDPGSLDPYLVFFRIGEAF